MKYPYQLNIVASALCLLAATGVQAQTDASKKPSPTPKTAAIRLAAAEPVEKAVLRVSCEGENVGAQISVNGLAKGPCPIDMEVPAGTSRIRAVKPISAEWERSFEVELTLGAGVARKVDVAVDYRRPTSERVKRWEAAANAGDAEAMYQLGWVYKWGTTRTIDFVKAASYFKAAAALNHPAGTWEYARAPGAHAGSPYSVVEALERKAAELGDADALAEIGDNLLLTDERKGQEYLRRAVAAGSPGAAFSMSLEESDPRARLAFRKREFDLRTQRSDAGDIDATQSLLFSYSKGSPEIGIAMDKQKADLLIARVFEYRKKAAATGDVGAIFRLGRYYSIPLWGGPQDKFLAEQAFRDAIAKGSEPAKDALQKLLAR